MGNPSEQLVDLRLFDDQRRRQRDDVAGRADQQAIVETGVEQLHRARGRRAWARFESEPRDETDGTNVDDMARALQAVRGGIPISGHELRSESGRARWRRYG